MKRKEAGELGQTRAWPTRRRGAVNADGSGSSRSGAGSDDSGEAVVGGAVPAEMCSGEGRPAVSRKGRIPARDDRIWRQRRRTGLQVAGRRAPAKVAGEVAGGETLGGGGADRGAPPLDRLRERGGAGCLRAAAEIRARAGPGWAPRAGGEVGRRGSRLGQVAAAGWRRAAAGLRWRAPIGWSEVARGGGHVWCSADASGGAGRSGSRV